ncbi:MAG: class I SAM-dependent methyltransferase [Oscillospiraceae bacterium]|nr:class I SAM-dependent methyltransferase [Oscillospiraceae bacterium]
MDNTKRFDGKGEIYAKSRPSYAAGLFDHIKSRLPVLEDSVFADIGSGTGIFSEQLLNCGYRVYAVEPNTDMRQIAEERLSKYKGFTSVDGADNNTNLPDQSVNFITVAQAFHWFDAEAFKKECKRILKQNGLVIIVYNFRDNQAACTKALADLRRKYNPEFHGFSNGISDEKCRAFFDGNCETFRVDNSQNYDRQGYINRVLSSSYSLRESDERYTEYLKEINMIFDKFADNGTITVPIYTIAYIGTII